MYKKNTSNDSVLDAKHMVNQNILSLAKMLVAGIGIIVMGCLLYIPGWYNFTLMMIVLIATIAILAILVYPVDSLNVNSQDGDRIRRINKQLSRKPSDKSMDQMSYEELKDVGRSLPDEEDE